MGYGKYTEGKDIKTGAMQFQTSAPLDDRTVILNKGSLISQNTWGDLGYIFKGMMTVTQDTGELYILKDKTKLTLMEDKEIADLTDAQLDAEISKSWVKASQDTQYIQSLINEKVSTLFQFKGVATAIDPDHTTLTIGKGTVSGDIGTAEKPNQISGPLVSYGTVLSENLGSVMYAWGTPKYRSLFYTKSPDPTQKQFYRRESQSTAYYIEVYNTLYFDTRRTEEVPYTTGEGENTTTGTIIYKVWEAINKGGTLYSVQGSTDKTVNIYATPSSEATPDPLISEVTVQDYTYWEFNEYEENKFTVNIDSTITTVTASPENNGHVYQIGEEEYASNGHMWVQLGSPKTDWIVL